MTRILVLVPALLSLSMLVSAHVFAYANGMYCLGGLSGTDQDSNIAVKPLFQLPLDQWWMHHVSGCDERPPAAGQFLQLPAGGIFTVEIAVNQAFTTFSWGGSRVSAWPDGATRPDDYTNPNCIGSAAGEPNIHTRNQSMAAGTAFAISYQSDLKKVTPDNLVVFTVRAHTPWKRITTYDVPSDLPPCPAGGCICTWGWVPTDCGEPNMYMFPYRCNVINSKSTKTLATPKPPVYCKDDPSKCVQGAKQMIFWNQLEGDNLSMPGDDPDGVQGLGDRAKPAYNPTTGFTEGAQNDIFVSAKREISHKVWTSREQHP